MSRAFDTVVLGGDVDALVAAIEIAKSGSKVLVCVEDAALGAVARQIEFSPGFHAAPFGRDLGWLPPEVLTLAGLTPLPKLEADPAAVAFGEHGPLIFRKDSAATAAAIRQLSGRDAERWPQFCLMLAGMAGFLETLYQYPAPRIDARSLPDLLSFAKIGRRFRSLRRSGMEALLRTIPMAVSDLLDDWFDSPLLKGALSALAVRDLCQGPMAGGTAFALLHQLVGAAPGVLTERLVVAGGAATIVDALARRAQAAGVVIQTGAPAEKILVSETAVCGLRLSSGEELACREVISAIEPYRTLLKLIDPAHLEVETIQTIRRIRYRGVTSVVLLALERLPALPAIPGAPTGLFIFAPSIGAVERAYDAVKYGRCSEMPVVEMHFPSVANPALAPVGKHVAVLRVQYTPYDLREQSWDAVARDSVGARAMKVVEDALPGFGACVTAGQVLAPPDLEATFGLREGAVSQGEMALDQILFMRPFPTAARHASPIPGLFLCGAGTHPGPGIAGVSAQLAARSVLAWRKTL